MTRSLAEALDQARRNEEWRSEYMKELLHDDDVRTDAFAEGRELGLSQGLSQGISQGLSQGLSQGITGFILDKIEDGVDKNTIVQKLEKVYFLSGAEAEEHVERAIRDRQEVLH